MAREQWFNATRAMLERIKSGALEFRERCFVLTRMMLCVGENDAFAPSGRDNSYATPPRAMPWAMSCWPYRPFLCHLLFLY